MIIVMTDSKTARNIGKGINSNKTFENMIQYMHNDLSIFECPLQHQDLFDFVVDTLAMTLTCISLPT